MLAQLGFGKPDCKYGYILGKSIENLGLVGVRMNLASVCYAERLASEYNTVSA
jgi:hypothetical protein